ncbi:hypothetical protein K469DRAFT_641512 [Zopfia rhizophila CBS 207.26]|uniref:Xylanolytic transcriptional activator regulatory domain-containing protein n=1 Tax=Zopfia rhizophila CBS 207.26 TaxID=1314779 RepID=A0A6A6DNT2_9PEZI|nr:hypothetical protein K469DRAFT_641512 [Zopfia rhizophila CBS 207.26]
MLCNKTSQTCTYPSNRLKPGPKTGSLQRGRQRLRSYGPRRSQECNTRSVNGDLEVGNQSALQEKRDGRRLASPSSRRRRTSESVMPAASIPFESALPPSQAPNIDEMLYESDSSDTAATNFVRAISLSSLIHPTHESCLTPPASVSDTSTSGFFVNLAGTQDLILQTCYSLNLSAGTLQVLIDSYFQNMTAISLFHQPSFGNKVQETKNLLHLKALFAAMLSFSARFERSQSAPSYHTPAHNTDSLSHERFHALALKFIQEAIEECADETPPLCLLQSLALTTYYLLTNSVRGRAWRLLGSCVRIAYELRLHLVDYEGKVDSPKVGVNLARWSADEERRRCWWAIWEMDVFASTIRRCPTAIDWTMNDTCLPIQDEFWFHNQYCPSCFLERRPMDRWKKLKESGNESASAWFIIINSLMRNAQVLSRGNLQGILPGSDPNNNVAQLTDYFRNAYKKKRSEEDSTQLTILAHALRCTTSVLPESLAYKGENLSFASMDQHSTSDGLEQSYGRLNSAKYSIYMITQLAAFMIYHHYAFGEILNGTIFAEEPRNPGFGWAVPDQAIPPNCKGLQSCLQAADNILAIINRSSEDHVKYVNPFHASTVWLATSLQILRKVFGPDVQVELTESKCEILRLSCQQYTKFWGTPLALLENLDSLEERLILRRKLSGKVERNVTRTNARPNTAAATRHTEPKRQESRNNNTSWEGLRHAVTMPPVALDGISSFSSDQIAGCADPACQAKSPISNSAGQTQTPSQPSNVPEYAEDHMVGNSSSGSFDHSSYLTLETMDAGSGFGEDFAWDLAGLMSESLSR